MIALWIRFRDQVPVRAQATPVCRRHQHGPHDHSLNMMDNFCTQETHEQVSSQTSSESLYNVTRDERC